MYKKINEFFKINSHPGSDDYLLVSEWATAPEIYLIN